MKKEKIQAIIFDVDGVLINNKDSLGQYLWKKDIQKDLGISPERTE